MTDDSDPQDGFGDFEPFNGEVPSINADSVNMTQHLSIPEDFDGEIEGAVPIEDLEALADEWEENGEAPDVACARELRKVLERYK